MRNAQLAQLVEQRTENPRVSGSIPELGTCYIQGCVAQLVEHLTFNQVVPGSNPGTLTLKERSSVLFLCRGSNQGSVSVSLRSDLNRHPLDV